MITIPTIEKELTFVRDTLEAQRRAIEMLQGDVSELREQLGVTRLPMNKQIEPPDVGSQIAGIGRR